MKIRPVGAELFQADR